MVNLTGIGASILRKEDRRFLTGRGTYVADIKRPDMTFGVFVRSPHAHARIKAIELDAALAMPGVAAVLTGDDLKRDGIGAIPCGAAGYRDQRRRRCLGASGRHSRGHAGFAESHMADHQQCGGRESCRIAPIDRFAQSYARAGKNSPGAEGD